MKETRKASIMMVISLLVMIVLSFLAGTISREIIEENEIGKPVRIVIREETEPCITEGKMYSDMLSVEDMEDYYDQILGQLA